MHGYRCAENQFGKNSSRGEIPNYAVKFWATGKQSGNVKLVRGYYKSYIRQDLVWEQDSGRN
jgi:hypothetical protein